MMLTQLSRASLRGWMSLASSLATPRVQCCSLRSLEFEPRFEARCCSLGGRPAGPSRAPSGVVHLSLSLSLSLVLSLSLSLSLSPSLSPRPLSNLNPTPYTLHSAPCTLHPSTRAGWASSWPLPSAIRGLNPTSCTHTHTHTHEHRHTHTQTHTLHCSLYTVHLTSCTAPESTRAWPSGTRSRSRCNLPYTLHPTPLHSTLYTLHPTPFTLHLTPFTLHPSPYTLHTTPYTLHPTPYTLHPTPYTLHPTLLPTP